MNSSLISAHFSNLMQPKSNPKHFKTAWEYFEKLPDASEARCKLCIKRKMIKCPNFGTSGLIKHLTSVHGMVHLTAKEAAKSSEVAVVVQESDDESETVGSQASPAVKKIKLESKQSNLDRFVKAEKESLQLLIAELVSKDGLNFNQIVKSRVLRQLFRKCGYELPKSGNTLQAYSSQEANRVRQVMTAQLKKITQQGKKLSLSIDEQTTTANFRILNVQVYSEAGNFNLGMVRIDIECDADMMVKVNIPIYLRTSVDRRFIDIFLAQHELGYNLGQTVFQYSAVLLDLSF